MKMFLISDNVDTYTGMRLAGVDGVVVHEREELRNALENVLSDKSVGIVAPHGEVRPGISRIEQPPVWNGKSPLLVEIPDRHEPDARKDLSRPISGNRAQLQLQPDCLGDIGRDKIFSSSGSVSVRNLHEKRHFPFQTEGVYNIGKFPAELLREENDTHAFV